MMVAAIVLLQQPSLYATAFPNPTGDNGWEEYLMAADIVSTTAADRLINYKYYLEPRNEGNIDGERNAVRALGRACDLVRTGNKKKLSPLQLSDDEDTNIAFSKGTGNIAKLFIMESRVRFASGRPDSGSESIIDGMTFGNRL